MGGLFAGSDGLGLTRKQDTKKAKHSIKNTWPLLPDQED